MDEDEWVAAVRSLRLQKAIKKLKPTLRTGPWWVLCDNESFLRTASSREAIKACRVKL